MNVIYTDGMDQDFIMLCNLLDDYLNEIVGGKKQREQYNQYNKLNDIHDVLLIYDDEQPIACASFKRYDQNTAEVKRVFVRKEYRGQGLSKLLMEKLEEKAKEEGYKSMVLETGKPLSEAMGLYKKIGYHITDNYGQYINLKESICMRKEFL